MYVPEPKRKYGYYVMPVLYGDRLVARLDPKFVRDSKTFVIKNWWWEKSVDKRDEAMLAAIQECLAVFCKYLGAAELRLGPEVKRETGLAKTVKGANPA